MRLSFLALLPLLVPAAAAQAPQYIAPGVHPYGVFEPLGDLMLFSAYTSAHGVEPWVTDGTGAGTHLLLDVEPGPDTSLPSILSWDLKGIEYGGYLYFRATTTAHGTELWRTDGTTAGTELFLDFEPGVGGSSPETFVLNGNLYIMATVTGLGREIWVSDGTIQGTRPLLDINPGPGSGVRFFARYGTEYPGPERLFWGDDGNTGFELWITDGTAAGTRLLKEINPGPDQSRGFPLFKECNGLVYFVANDGVHGGELWVTDLTTQGTQLVRDIRPGPDSSSVDLRRCGCATNGLVFEAPSVLLSLEPWRTDGTPAGTVPLGDYVEDTWNNNLQVLELTNGRVVVGAKTPTLGYEPISTDGTVAGTFIIDFEPGPGSSSLYSGQLWRAAGERAFIPVFTPQGNLVMAVSDGTVAGTRRIPFPGTAPSGGPIAVVDEFLIWGGPPQAYSDGTDEATGRLASIPGEYTLGAIYELARAGDWLIFYGQAQNDPNLPPIQSPGLWSMPADFDGDDVVDLVDRLNAVVSCTCEAAVAPCGNADDSGGCSWSSAGGARLRASGSSFLAQDSLVLTASGLPSSTFSLLFMGTDMVPPAVLGDGLRCVGAPLYRLALQPASVGGTTSFGPGLAALALPQVQIAAGETWHFQAWYRSTAGTPCGSGSNVTDATSILFMP